jgi:hypothetical protein
MPYALPLSFSTVSWIFLTELSRSRWAGWRGGSWSSWNIDSRCSWNFLLPSHCRFRLSRWGAFLTLRSHRKGGKQSRSKRLMQVGSCFCITLSCWSRLDIPSLMLRSAVLKTFLCAFPIFLYGTWQQSLFRGMFLVGLIQKSCHRVCDLAICLLL